MPKGVPWSKTDTDVLLDLRVKGKTISEIASGMGKSEQAVAKKLERLGLKVVHLEKSCQTTTSELILPKELLTVEEALKVFTAAMKALEAPDLPKSEVMRLRTLMMGAKTYQEKFAEYVNYLGIERELFRLREEISEIRKTEQES
jgi:hypothetical protein